MRQDEHYEWPSFEAVLRDVATDDARQRPDPEIVSTPRDSSANESIDVLIDPDLLPEPLPPLEIDTSMIRALLEPRTPLTTEEFELDALTPLAPPAFDLDSDPPSVFDLDGDPPSVFDLESDPPSVFDLAFDESAEADVIEEPAIIADVPGIDLPEFGGTPIDIFEDLGLTNEISLENLPAHEDLPGGAVFELDETTLSDTDSVDSEHVESLGPDYYQLPDQFEDSNGFDSVATADAIEGELSELTDMTGLDSELENPDDASAFAELLDLDNVIPIRPVTKEDDDPASPEQSAPSQPSTRPSATDVSQTGWVGLDQAAPPSVDHEEEHEDPWAYMRPSEEPKSGGIWEKLFGGEERKIAKAKRRAKANEETTETTETTVGSPDVSFDSRCPNCGDGCQVDLDDPIGQRVHVSCPSCDHMWFTPYVIDSQTG